VTIITFYLENDPQKKKKAILNLIHVKALILTFDKNISATAIHIK